MKSLAGRNYWLGDALRASSGTVAECNEEHEGKMLCFFPATCQPSKCKLLVSIAMTRAIGICVERDWSGRSTPDRRSVLFLTADRSPRLRDFFPSDLTVIRLL